MSRLIFACFDNHISYFVNSSTLLRDHQYEFRTGSSCTSQLIHFFHSWASALDRGNLTNAVFLDFAKTFHSVSHKHLLAKLQYFGIKMYSRTMIVRGRHRVHQYCEYYTGT